MKTESLVEWLRGYSFGMNENGNHVVAEFITMAADRLEQTDKNMRVARNERNRAKEKLARVQAANEELYSNFQSLEELKADRDHLLEIAKKMHLWIFKNTFDEYEAYKECGLTDEDDIRLGYGGRFEIEVKDETSN